MYTNSTNNTPFIFFGRPDGIGNRVEQLINLQEYCIEYGRICIYVWRNSNSKSRTYKNQLSFDHIIIKEHLDTTDKYETKDSSIFNRKAQTCVKYQFNFKVSTSNYDTIVHIRATDRLHSNICNPDYSNESELKDYIEKTINYINTNDSIKKYAIVSDDSKYIDYMEQKITKPLCKLSYDQAMSKDWLDYYYLTAATERIVMCCKFSSYSVTAAILANIRLLIFPDSLTTSLPRFKANIEIIS